MTSMERIGALAQGQLPDRVPIVCNLFEQGATELGTTIKDYYSKPENIVEGQLKLQRKYGYDCVWGFSYTGAIAEMLGCRNIVYSNDGPPNVGHMVLNRYEDIEKFEIPENLDQTEAMQSTSKILHLLKNEVGGKIPVLTNMVSAFSLPAILIGMEKWFELLLLGPYDLRDLLLEKCTQFNEKLIVALRNAGADMIAYANPLSSTDFITSKQFNELCLPWIKKDFEKTGTDGIVYFNGGSPINSTIETLLTEIGFGAFYIHPNDNIKEAKEIINGRALSTGIINDIKLLSWSKTEVEHDVQRIINEGKEGGGFIFGTLVMPFNIPEENIFAMVNAAKKYGSY